MPEGTLTLSATPSLCDTDNHFLHVWGAALLAYVELYPSLHLSASALTLRALSCTLVARSSNQTNMSLTAMPEIKLMPTERVSMEEMHEEKTAVQLKGGTRDDSREMARMGKTQELRVSCHPSLQLSPD